MRLQIVLNWSLWSGKYLYFALSFLLCWLGKIITWPQKPYANDGGLDHQHPQNNFKVLQKPCWDEKWIQTDPS